MSTRAIQATTQQETGVTAQRVPIKQSKGALEKIKVLKPLPHAVIDYAWAGAMISAPWLLKFNDNKAATINSVANGVAILGLSLVTRYPLGAAKLVSFPVHGVIEAVAGALTALDPWLLGFSDNKRAKLAHLISGLSTLAVVAITDYRAAERSGRR